ncbi:pyroglutamyl-peptidase 1 [Boleophthalmus pectinirostris]|uniref:pyroglutamyl-peptidase 1 n=1 Tax=Boleophthalmus pectinirostris TaxID=150288 RepID=UPI000A1C4C13|nr:pyroglutamyl-peptidase 1 [Boleophthalmus pectinirostris]
MANKKKVIVTGFEPFGEHAVNASWVAVQELDRIGLGEDIDLFVCEVPVEYQAVQTLLPSMWEEHQPLLVVHVGVSGLAKAVTLEQCGHNKGYRRLDNCCFSPESECCIEDGPECISSVLDMEAVCKRVSEAGGRAKVTVSKDAGRYLCDYTYYTSLFVGNGRSAFIHVPPLGKPYSSEELGRALQTIITEMLTQLEGEHAQAHCNHKGHH